eukprot:5292163-Ditylum_brightwellii.AAC.1
MLADQNLIRVLAACETMGNATNICSDKTGTLTENRMTVVKGIFADKRHDNAGDLNKPASISAKALHIMLQGISTCSTARVVAPEHQEDRPQIIGNKTEAALILLSSSVWGRNDNTDSRRSSARFGKRDGSRLFPFSSARKRMSVIVNQQNFENSETSEW